MKQLLITLSFFTFIANATESYIPCGFFNDPEGLSNPASLNTKIKTSPSTNEIPIHNTASLSQVERSDLDAFYLVDGNSLFDIKPTGFTDVASAQNQSEAEKIVRELNKKNKNDNHFANYVGTDKASKKSKSGNPAISHTWTIYEKQVTDDDIKKALNEADLKDPGYQHYPRETGSTTQIYRVIPKNPRKVSPEMTKLSSANLYLKFMNDSTKNKVVRFHMKSIDNVTEFIPCNAASIAQMECLKLQNEELKKLESLNNNAIKSIHINLEILVNPLAEIESTARSEASRVILDHEELRIVPSYKEKVPYKKELNNLVDALAANCEIVRIKELTQKPQTPQEPLKRTDPKNKHFKNILSDG